MNSLKFYLTILRYRPNMLLSLIFLVVFSFLVVVPLIQIIRISLTYQPNDLRVVRDATVINGRIVREGGVSYFCVGDTLRKPVDSQLDQAAGDAIATIRPEDVQVSKERRDDWFEFQVYFVLPAGAETIVTVHDEDLALAIKLGGFADIEMNDMIWVDFDADKMNYDDPRTEKLLL